jgi:hypothetical protein
MNNDTLNCTIAFKKCKTLLFFFTHTTQTLSRLLTHKHITDILQKHLYFGQSIYITTYIRTLPSISSVQKLEHNISYANA